MKLSKEEYRNAIGILKRYNYNCMTIINIKSDLMDLSDNRDKQLRKALLECNIIKQALELVNNDSKYIFKELYIKSKSKWQIIDSGMSERTFERRKNELVYAVDSEIKKIGGKLAEF